MGQSCKTIKPATRYDAAQSKRWPWPLNGTPWKLPAAGGADAEADAPTVWFKFMVPSSSYNRCGVKSVWAPRNCTRMFGFWACRELTTLITMFAMSAWSSLSASPEAVAASLPPSAGKSPGSDGGRGLV